LGPHPVRQIKKYFYNANAAPAVSTFLAELPGRFQKDICQGFNLAVGPAGSIILIEPFFNPAINDATFNLGK
jgi:hypothetical protein